MPDTIQLLEAVSTGPYANMWRQDVKTFSCWRTIRRNKDDLAKMTYNYETHYKGNISIYRLLAEM